MKKLAIAIAIVLAGCAVQPKVDPAFQSLTEWSKTSLSMAEAGQITWESRYIKSFELSASIQSQTVRTGMRKAYSDMIPIARKFDAKQISKPEFEDYRRSTNLAIETTFNAARNEDAQNQAMRNAELAQILQNNQQQQNLIYEQQMQQYQPKRQTNCTSNIYGNTVQTNCR